MMYQGRHIRPDGRPRRLLRRELVLLCAVAALMLGLVGGTVAYLVTHTGPVKNEFTPPTQGVTVNEEFDEVVKENVTVTNQAEFAVYVRATYVAYWVSDDGSILPEVPNLQNAYINEVDWTFRQEDGYWYYTQKLESGETTQNFINKMTAPEKAGCHLVVDVITETVQAEPEQAAQDVWGYVPGKEAAQ